MLRSFGRPLALAALFALALVPQVDAAATPEADKVIRRYVNATGGAAAFAAEGSLYTRARLTGFGFSGSLETWSVRPDKHYARTELGPFKLSEGSDGRTAWRTDPTTGRVVTLTDQDLAEALASTWYELERWAEPDNGGGTITVTGHEKDAKGTYTVLTMVPPGGETLKPRRMWFSDATGLLARIEAPRDQNQIATDFSDWRQAAGRLRSFVNESGISNMPANRMTSTADSFAVNVPTEGLAFQAPLPVGLSTVRWRGANGVLTLPSAPTFAQGSRVELADNSTTFTAVQNVGSTVILDVAGSARRWWGHDPRALTMTIRESDVVRCTAMSLAVVGIDVAAVRRAMRPNAVLVVGDASGTTASGPFGSVHAPARSGDDPAVLVARGRITA